MPTPEVPEVEPPEKGKSPAGEDDETNLFYLGLMQSDDPKERKQAEEYFYHEFDTKVVSKVLGGKFGQLQHGEQENIRSHVWEYVFRKMRAGEFDPKKSSIESWIGASATSIGKNKRVDIIRKVSRVKTIGLGAGGEEEGEKKSYDPSADPHANKRIVPSSTQELTPEEKILATEIKKYLLGVKAGKEPFPWRIRLKGKILTPEELERVKAGMKPEEYQKLRKTVEDRMTDMFMSMYGLGVPKKNAGEIQSEMGLTRHAQRDTNTRMKDGLRRWVGEHAARLERAGIENPTEAYERFLAKLTNLLSGPTGYKIVERKKGLGSFLSIVSELDAAIA